MLYKFKREINGAPLEFGLKAAVTGGVIEFLIVEMSSGRVVQQVSLIDAACLGDCPEAICDDFWTEDIATDAAKMEKLAEIAESIKSKEAQA
ncbi:hypothetical protein [Caudoviricetes sp.]|nr:hypothetical protein [Caudoviricetes sp.]